jgi:hypothetical protein
MRTDVRARKLAAITTRPRPRALSPSACRGLRRARARP